jgi:hypothetical protein
MFLVQLLGRISFLVRLVGVLLAIAVGTGVFLWYFGLPLEAGYAAIKAPVLKETPIPIRDSSVTRSPGRKLAFCGCEYDIPWSDLDETKTKVGVNSTILYFDSGLVTLLKCEPPREFVESVLSSFKLSPENFRRAFGESVLDSDYALTGLMLGTTPDEITFRTPHRYQASKMAMLVLKATATPRADSGMFSIHTEEFDGFQYQDPQRIPDWVLLDLFASDRGLEFQFFLNYHGASPHVSQADINRVIRTVRKISPYSLLKNTSLKQSH